MKRTHSEHHSIEFNVITVPDVKTKQFSAFFAQFPQAISVGESEEEAITKLIPLVNRMLSDKKSELISGMGDFEYTEKPLNAQFAL